MRIATLAAAAAAALVLVGRPAVLEAWGAHGHRLVGSVAAEKLPAEMPAFFRAAARQLSYLNPEPDRWRGRTDADRDGAMDAAAAPEHYIDIELIPEARRAGIFAAPSRIAYADSLRQLSLEAGGVGFLPFRIVELSQRLRTEFRLWRTTTDPETRAWIEQRIINDAGILGHYVADASNPAHTSIHHNGWVGDNPKGYATDKRFHSRFESAFVEARVKESDVRAVATAAPRVLPVMRAAVLAHITESHAQLEPLYELDKQVAFDSANTSAKHKQFAAARLASAATMLRDIWWTAWVTSEPPPPQSGDRTR